ncbi:Nucleolar protein 16 [Zancudomyces culisetae]|uniref:Nucleolar protein 16 n=1 Tax=Zancudomyces culisetae TaxID=1213189 RepID=A0A1R1PK57_ZANCU|nr:Nucleolar protein 16 [Zancudomyces culisetae]|eukprot:OMH81319.1 Nucleolar protein 16 [Zancudomyces culisetae]
MANPRARKKLKNPKLKVSGKPKKKLKFKGLHLLKDGWNKKGSVAENYKRVGLVSKLNGISGGANKKFWLDVPSYQKKQQEEQEGEPQKVASEENEFADIEEMLEDQKVEYAQLGGKNYEELTEEEMKKYIPAGYGIIKRDSKGKVEKIIVPETGEAGEEEEEEEEEEEIEREKAPVEPKTDIARSKSLAFIHFYFVKRSPKTKYKS